MFYNKRILQQLATNNIRLEETNRLLVGLNDKAARINNNLIGEGSAIPWCNDRNKAAELRSKNPEQYDFLMEVLKTYFNR